MSWPFSVPFDIDLCVIRRIFSQENQIVHALWIYQPKHGRVENENWSHRGSGRRRRRRRWVGAEGWLYPMMLSAVSRWESYESQLSNRQFSIKKHQTFFPVLFKTLRNKILEKKGQRKAAWERFLDPFHVLQATFPMFISLSGPFFMFEKFNWK